MTTPTDSGSYRPLRTVARAVGWAFLIGLVITGAVMLLSACGPTTSNPHVSPTAAKSALHSAEANPTISNAVTTAEDELLANLQKHFDPAHPVTSVEAAVQATYPGGSTGKITTYAVTQFTPADTQTGQAGKTARAVWAAKVTTYAEGLGAPSSPSPQVSK